MPIWTARQETGERCPFLANSSVPRRRRIAACCLLLGLCAGCSTSLDSPTGLPVADPPTMQLGVGIESFQPLRDGDQISLGILFGAGPVGFFAAVRLSNFGSIQPVFCLDVIGDDGAITGDSFYGAVDVRYLSASSIQRGAGDVEDVIGIPVADLKYLYLGECGTKRSCDLEGWWEHAAGQPEARRCPPKPREPIVVHNLTFRWL